MTASTRGAQGAPVHARPVAPGAPVDGAAEFTVVSTADPAAVHRAGLVLAWAGIAGAAVAAVLVGVLHLLPSSAGISPLSRTISEYALTESGWMFNVAVLALALGSFAVLASLILSGRTAARSTGFVLGAAWVAALTVVVVFPKHNWSVGPSTGGQIHRVASIVAFLCLPLAVILLTRARGGARRRLSAHLAFWSAVMALAWLGSLIGAWALSPLTGVPWYRAFPLGLVERGLVFFEVAAVVALACWALASARSPIPPGVTDPPAMPAMSATPSPPAPAD